MADFILEFAENPATDVYVDVKATAEDIKRSGKGPNITSFRRIRDAYLNNPDFLFLIVSLKHKVIVRRNNDTGIFETVLEIIECSVYDFKYLAETSITYNPSLGTGQIQITNMHRVTLQTRTTWQMCQLLDRKYLHSSKRSFDDYCSW